MAESTDFIRPDNPQCSVCKKEAHEIPVYVAYAEMEGMTPEDFIYMNEGTFNYRNNLFYCNKCYIKIGMPSGKAVPI